MAGKNIKGITIEIDGDTSGLTQALKKVDNETKSVQTELKQVDRLLKFDPSNVELLSQKQKLLGDAIDGTSKRLDALKQAQSEVERQFKAGEIGEEAYRKFQREIIATEGKLKAFKSQADAVKIKLDAQVDTSGLDKMKQKLDEVADKAKEVGDKMKDVGTEMSTKLSAPLVAFGGGALLAAGQFDNAAGQIQAALGVTADEAESLEDRAKNVWKAGFGESLEEVTNALVRVKQNIKGISDEAELERVTQDALALAKTFDSDVVEVTRAANNLMTNFGLSSEEAFDKMAKGAQNGLNFSNEMFDNLAEYAPLFADAGYSADEMFTLLEKGTAKGIYNLDYLNDVVKEFGIRLTDGSKGTADSLAVLFQPEGFEDFIGNLATAGKQSEEFKELVKMVGTESATTMVEGLQKGGKTAEDTILAMQKTMGGYGEIVQGLQDGTISTSDAMEMIIGKLNEIEDPIERNMHGVQLFGTKWEDLGADVVLSLGGVKGALNDTEGAMKSVTDAQEDTFGQRWDNLVRSSASALEPVGKVLLDFAEQWLPKIIALIESLANWFSNLSPIIQVLIVAFGAVVAAIGPFLVIVGSIISAVGNIIPIVLKVVDVFGKFGGAAGAISGPVGIAIGVITALIAIGVLLYKNWDEIVEWCKKSYKAIADTIKNYLDTAKKIVSDTMEYWKKTFQNALSFLKSLVTGDFQGIKNAIQNQMQNAQNLISNILNSIKGFFQNLLGQSYDIVVQKFTSMVSSVREKMNNVLSAIKEIWGNVTSFFSGINLYDIGKNIILGLVNGIKSMASNVIDSITGVVDGAINGAKKLLGIKSPSRVFMEIGEFTNEGFIKGIENTSKQLQNAVGSVYGSLASSAQKSAQIATSSVTSSTSTINNSKYMQPNITIINQGNNLSPAQIARQSINQQRQLAMEWGI